MAWTMSRMCWIRSAGFPCHLAHDLANPNVRENLTGIVRDESFQEAVFLSNRESFERIRTLAEGGWSGTRKRLQERSRLAWMYLQRFCTKNDTTSFYGPISWGEVVNASTRLAVEPSSKGWLARREIFLEHWAIQAVANVISDDPEIYPHLPIYLNPACKVEDETLCLPVGRRVPLRGDAGLLLSRFNRGMQCHY